MMDVWLPLIMIVTVCVYAVMMIRWFIGWNLDFRSINTDHSMPHFRVTVVVAVRNEAERIVALLGTLSGQRYSKDLYEIIISDDFSEDDTLRLVREFISQNQSGVSVRLVQPEASSPTGKKAALDRAIAVSEGEIILTTDADCEMSNDWLAAMTNCFRDSQVNMAAGWVRLRSGRSLFSQLQAFEFLSLAGTTAATLISDFPLMCNGANLAFRKTAYLKFRKSGYGTDVPSGDDTFFMLHTAAESSGSVVFCHRREAIVTSETVDTFRDFIAQRIRWAGKVKLYREWRVKFTGLIVLLTNLILVVLPFMAMAGLLSVTFAVSLWTVKLIADILLLMKSAAFADQCKLLWLFLPASILYPFYQVLIGMISILRPRYHWKNRQWK